MSLAHQSTPLPPKPGISMSDWQRTPTTVQDEFLALLKRVDTLEARLNRDSSNSNRPPSTDSGAKKREREWSGEVGGGRHWQKEGSLTTAATAD